MRRLFYSVTLLCAFFSFHPTAFSQNFSLTRDINLGPEYNYTRPENLTGIASQLFFTIKDGPMAGLWKTNGSSASTTRLKVVADPEIIESIVASNNQVFFTIYNSSTARTTLWKSDGTDAGTILLQTILDFRVQFPTAINGSLYFVLNGVTSFDLMKSDGTVGGISILKGGATSIQNLVDVNGTLFFTATESSPSYQRLWKTNGTTAGTVLVKDISTSGGSTNIVSLINANGTLFFRGDDGIHGDELWKSDGTSGGTVLVSDLLPGIKGSAISNLTAINNKVYFFAKADDGIYILWSSDGTDAGTFVLQQFQIDPNNSAGPKSLTSVEGLLYFNAFDGSYSKLWVSDGTPAETKVLKNASPFSSATNLFNANGVLYFTRSGEIWKSDGTDAGTVLVKNGFQTPLFGGAVNSFSLANGLLFFSAYDLHYGYEVWKSDGTTNNTVVVKDILPSPNSDPQHFVGANGIVYFSTINFKNSPTPQSGRSIFQTDGTFPGTASSEHIFNQGFSTPLDMIGFNGEFYFSGRRDTKGYEVYKISGNGGAPVMVKNINPLNPNSSYRPGSNPHNFLSVGPSLFFVANDGTNGFELWKTDGTEAGTVLVKEINPGGDSNPDSLVNVNGTLYFKADNGTDGIELWKSDGTEAGTVMVKNINSAGNSNPSYLTAVGSVLYFAADDGVNGVELWKSDGTNTGTVLVKNINAATGSNPSALANINGVLYFSANDGISGAEPWKSDGSNLGTSLLKDIFSGPTGSNPTLITNINGVAVFTADDGIAGREIWASFGTSIGTTLVKDILPGGQGSNPTALKKIGSNILFAANDGVHGNEVWLTNGFELTTRPMGEIEPGAGSSNPTEFFEYGSKVLVAATGSLVGSEVWIADIPVASPLPLELLEFKGAIAGNNGLLQWKTENENNTSSFIVERSLDGQNYSSAGSVSAANTAGIHYYDFTDVNITSLGVNNIYYRLKQTDLDGKYTYSSIVVLSIGNKKSIVMVYPNPAKDKLYMTFTVAQHEQLQWQLTDNTGRTIKTGIYNVNAGSSTVAIDVAGLGSGIYLMQLNGTTIKQRIKVVKQ